MINCLFVYPNYEYDYLALEKSLCYVLSCPDQTGKLEQLPNG